MGKAHRVIVFKYGTSKKIIFQSVKDCCKHFHCGETSIRARISSGEALVYKDELYYFDYMIEEER